MAFNGKEGEQITLTEASSWTENYRNTASIGDPKGHFFGKDLLQQILDQSGCMGIRIYYGINEGGKNVLVLVGADSNENDITDLIVDKSKPCPSYCGRDNDLNS